MGVNGMWEPGDPRADEYMQWIRSAWERHLPFSTGRNYVNFLNADEGDERVRATYGTNYERLAAAKRAYDPGQPLPDEPQRPARWLAAAEQASEGCDELFRPLLARPVLGGHDAVTGVLVEEAEGDLLAHRSRRSA